MLSCKLDWLTLTIKPDGTISNCLDFAHAWKSLECSLLLGSFMERAKMVGKKGNYERCYSHENMLVQLPSADDWAHQGLCISISSEGLDFFAGYLHEMGLNLKEWLSAFRHLAFSGYKTKVTRFDWAFDDIVFEGEESTLSIKRVLSAISDNEMCMKSRVWSDEGGDILRLVSPRRSCKKVSDKYFNGVTVNVGSRSSETFCRFYDKFAELMQKKRGVGIPNGCTAWTRFEMEFKGGNAMACLNNFLDLSDDDFSKWIRGVALNYIRFVERTSNNVSRCVSKRWWRDFLNGTTKAIQLPRHKPARAVAVRWSKWFKSQIFPSLNTARHYMEDDKAFLDWLDNIELELALEHKKTQRKDLLDNFNDGRRFYEFLSSEQEWQFCSELTAKEFRENLERYQNHWYWFCQHFNAYLRGDGQLVL